MPFVDYVYELPEAYAEFYIKLVSGLHSIAEQNASSATSIQVVNMSLQPLQPYPYNEKEAVNVATRVLCDVGVVTVIAVGNHGEKGGNTLNPWSVAPWVIGVGAADSQGKQLWPGSSVGVQGDPLLQPTVVAPGIKVKAVRVPGVDVHTPGDPEEQYVEVTGTSFATGHVSGIVATAIQFVKESVANAPTFSEWKETVDREKRIGVGPIAPTPKVIKRMMEDMAVKMPKYGLHEVGAGFVNHDISQRYFANFKLSNFVKVFCGSEI